MFIHLVMTVKLQKSVTQLTNKEYCEPPLMSVKLWQSHDEFQPVLVVALLAVHSAFPEHAFGIPELTEQSPTVPVLTIQQPATLCSPAGGSVTKRAFNRSADTYNETDNRYKSY